MNMKSIRLNATARQRRGPVAITLLTLVLASLSCASNRDTEWTGQPAAGDVDKRDAAEAAGVLRNYFAAISDRDYARAYRYWQGDGHASGRTFNEFQSGLSDVTAANADIGAPRNLNADKAVVGAQNLSFPVRLRLTHTNGSQECLEGRYAMTKPVVPNARWMISSSNLTAC